MLPQTNNDWSLVEAGHLLRRAGFGGSPDEIANFHALGRLAAVESLLNPSEPIDAFPLPEWAERENALANARENSRNRRQAMQSSQGMSPEEVAKARQEIQRERQRESRRRNVEGNAWWIQRILQTKAPLREKMVLFWHDHFATSVRKVKQPALILAQNHLFRERAFGDFRALTHDILRDPAMMIYLDTQSSKKGKPNENFAREVMELFTLGEGQYDEKDIKEAARAFTGYVINRSTGRVIHVKSQWDEGDKTILGRSGALDGDQVIDLIFEQDAAAAYLPSKLWRFFVEDEAPPAVVRKLAKGFRASGFKLEPLLREIFLSRAFYDNSVIHTQIKSPIQFLAQMCKELELSELPRGYPIVVQEQLGQALFTPPNVAGWDWGKAWINTNTLLSRYNIAGIVTKGAKNPDQQSGNDDQSMMEMSAGGGKGGKMAGRMITRAIEGWDGPDYEAIAPRPLREDPDQLVDQLIGRFFQSDPGSKQRDAFVAYAGSIKGAVFTNHEVAELCHLMMSTPRYQLA